MMSKKFIRGVFKSKFNIRINLANGNIFHLYNERSAYKATKAKAINTENT